MVGLPSGRVAIRDAYLMDDRLRVEVFSEMANAERFVDFSAWSYGETQGFGVSVRDPGEGLTWEMQWESDGVTFMVSEATGDLALDIAKKPSEDRLWCETYRLRQGKALAYQRFLYDPTSDADIARARLEFREFWPQGTELENNHDGLLAAQLLTSEDFVSWLEGEFTQPGAPHDSPGNVPYDPISTYEKICTIAGACGLLKCPFGGIGNPLCHACGGVGIACTMANLVCWLLNC